MAIIIGIGHRSRMGKDTVAQFMYDYIKDNYKLDVQKVSWADKLKDIAYQLYGHLGLQTKSFYETEEGAKLRNIKLPKINLSPVEIWVELGEKIKDVYLYTWVDLVHQCDADIIICPDTRNEIEYNSCDYTINVHNSRVPLRSGKSIDDKLIFVKSWDYRIENDGTLDDLKNKARDIADDIVKDILLCYPP